MEKWEDILKGIIRKAGTLGLEELGKALEKLEEESKKPWQKAILNMVGDLLSEHGLDGLAILENLVDKIEEGETPDLSFASLRDRSDYLAAIQNMEADDRKQVRLFFSKVGHSLGVVVKAVIAGILG